MDWTALRLSLLLGALTVLILLPSALFLARFLAYHDFAGNQCWRQPSRCLSCCPPL